MSYPPTLSPTNIIQNNLLLQSFTLTEFSVAVGTILSSLTACLLVCFKSRCTFIKCCGLECQRKLIDEKDIENNIQPEPEELEPEPDIINNP